MTRLAVGAISLLVSIVGVSGCGTTQDPPTNSSSVSEATTPALGEGKAELGQPLSDDTPFGSPPTWVFQGQGGWNIDRMDASTSQMTEVSTDCHLTLQARLLRAPTSNDEVASRAEIKRLVGEVEEEFGSISVSDDQSLILTTLPTSKDPDTGIEFVRTQVNYSHDNAPRDWSVVLAARSFVVDQVTLVLGYSCPREQMGERRKVDALLARTARINSQ